MRRLMVGLAILAIAAGSAFAHGGGYSPPNGEVPPNMRKPHDPPPPPDDPPTPTPPPDDKGGSETPDDPGGNRPGEPPTAPPPGDETGPRAVPGRPPVGPRDGGTQTPAGRRPSAPRSTTYDSWVFWWEYNDDDVLNLGSRRRARNAAAGTTGSLVNVGEVHRRGAGRQAPSDIAIDSRVIPALERALDPALDADIRASAVIALARVASTRSDLAVGVAGRLVAIMRNESGREPDTVEESAALALGLLQLDDAKVVTALRTTLLDREARTRTRAFAALALGFLRVGPFHDGHDDVVDALRMAVASPGKSGADVPVCALVAMGLSEDAAFEPDLLAMVRTGRAYGQRKLDDLQLSYAVASLGRLTAVGAEARTRETLDVLRRIVVSGGTQTVNSAVVALGVVGRREALDRSQRAEIVRTLEYVTRKSTTQAANFAAIGLGRIANVIDDQALRGRIFDVLRDRMARGSFDGRPFGALALGLMGSGGRADAAVVETVRRAFVEHDGDPRNRGAWAIVLGMLGDRKAVPALLATLRDRGEAKSLRGACAVGLGLIGDSSAVRPIRDVLVNDVDPQLRADSAVAAGLIGGREVIPDLIRILEDSRSSLFVQGSTALALGRIGDRRAIDSLIALAEDADAQDISRALAVVALGLLGDRNDLPVLSRLSKDINYRAQVDAIREVLSIL